jgi:hypothetical protein
MRTRHMELVKWFDQFWWRDSTAASLAKATGKGKPRGKMYVTTNNPAFLAFALDSHGPDE